MLSDPFTLPVDQALVRWCQMVSAPMCQPSLVAHAEMALLHAGETDPETLHTQVSELIWVLGVMIRENVGSLKDAWAAFDYEWVAAPLRNEAIESRLTFAFTRRFRAVGWRDAEEVLGDLRTAVWLAMTSGPEVNWADELPTAGQRAVDRALRSADNL